MCSAYLAQVSNNLWSAMPRRQIGVTLSRCLAQLVCFHANPAANPAARKLPPPTRRGAAHPALAQPRSTDQAQDGGRSCARAKPVRRLSQNCRLGAPGRSDGVVLLVFCLIFGATAVLIFLANGRIALPLVGICSMSLVGAIFQIVSGKDLVPQAPALVLDPGESANGQQSINQLVPLSAGAHPRSGARVPGPRDGQRSSCKPLIQ